MRTDLEREVGSIPTLCLSNREIHIPVKLCIELQVTEERPLGRRLRVITKAIVGQAGKPAKFKVVCLLR